MSDGGVIVFTTSWFDEAGVAGTSVVSASKAALRNLTRTLASELIGRNIRVNAVSPGVIETPLFDKLGLPEGDARELGKALLQQIPAKRFGKPEEVATAVAFLASDHASPASSLLSTAAALTYSPPRQDEAHFLARLQNDLTPGGMNMAELANTPATTQGGKVVYTAKTHTTGGRENGASRSSDGHLDIKLPVYVLSSASF